MVEAKASAAGVMLTAASLADIGKDLPGSTVTSVQKILSSVRLHLNMDVAFVSEFVGKDRYFRNVDAKGNSPIRVGDSMPLTDGYCQRVVDGLLPELIIDTADNPLAMSLPDTVAVPIGSHVSIPIRLKSGRVYGTFCCFSFQSDRTLNERDLSVMRAFADIAAFQIDYELEVAQMRALKTGRVGEALERQQPSIAFQPVISLADMQIYGMECLARFDMNPYRAPNLWFADANSIGYGATLELQAIRNAIDDLRTLHLPENLSVWLNVSAATILGGQVRAQLGDLSLSRVVLELTEHEHVADYQALAHALAPMRAAGARVAIDDAGAGYSSMSHILNIEPEIIKLDLSLTRQIDADRKRCALAAALIEFARQTNAMVVAEGVESAAELAELKRIGVHLAQGYFLCEPTRGDRLATAIAGFDERRGLAEF
jgi:EAL domain-containing protein (putative c-di-GMP-specific phosphodiesterase class I)